MQETVHILATVRKAELLEAATLVFATLRTGFPTNPVCVWGNGLAPQWERVLGNCARSVQGEFRNLPATSHDEWVEGLLQECRTPYWICDTDMIFWGEIRSPKSETRILEGRFEPGFDEEWTGTRHVERLHTCLLRFDPGKVRAAMRAWMAKIPAPWGLTAEYPFVRQHFIPVREQKAIFYDTCAGLWQAEIGTAFTEEQNDCFEHLHCATYVDLAGPSIGDGTLGDGHRAVYENPERARGLRQRQELYYASRRGETTN